ncbi:MAG: hypothetical protein QXK37_00360 [Candidatus Woesearchaeota archaeon]
METLGIKPYILKKDYIKIGGVCGDAECCFFPEDIIDPWPLKWDRERQLWLLRYSPYLKEYKIVRKSFACKNLEQTFEIDGLPVLKSRCSVYDHREWDECVTHGEDGKCNYRDYLEDRNSLFLLVLRADDFPWLASYASPFTLPHKIDGKVTISEIERIFLPLPKDKDVLPKI